MWCCACWRPTRPCPPSRSWACRRNLLALKEAINRPYGLVLCVGPTGSGKTTTLHSALSCINTPERKIWTAEDPVEITQVGLRQVQVNPKIDWTLPRPCAPSCGPIRTSSWSARSATRKPPASRSSPR
jgi:energy-coupling factor transporter ATP-binding protein EcfA2